MWYLHLQQGFVLILLYLLTRKAASSYIQHAPAKQSSGLILIKSEHTVMCQKHIYLLLCRENQLGDNPVHLEDLVTWDALGQASSSIARFLLVCHVNNCAGGRAKQSTSNLSFNVVLETA